MSTVTERREKGAVREIERVRACVTDSACCLSGFNFTAQQPDNNNYNYNNKWAL